MKKRGLSILLAAAMILGSCPVSVWAEFEITTSDSQEFQVSEDASLVSIMDMDNTSEPQAAPADDKGYQWYTVNVESDGETNSEIFLKMDGVWYISTDQIEYYTDYLYYAEEMTFRPDTEGDFKGLSKAIFIDISNHTAFVKGYLQTLENIYEYNEQIYLPVHQILPLMECACEVEENVFHVENAETSLTEALYDYVPEVIYFDAAEEFAGQSWANMVMVGSAYWFDSFSGLKWQRLVGLGNYEDYKAAVTDYLTKYEVYEKVMESRSSSVDTAKSAKKSRDASKGFLTQYDFLGLVHDMLDHAGNAEDFYSWIPKDIYKEISTWGTVAEVSGDALDAAVNYTLMVKDHRDMLEAVYPEIDGSVNDMKLRGIKKVYDVYGSSGLYAIWTATVESLTREGFWYLVEKGSEAFLGTNLGMYKAMAKISGEIMKKYVSQLGIKDPDAMALLNHHIILTNEARETYNALLTAPYSRETAEALRLTALMTMVSSKRCFEIIRDNNALMGDITSYCDNRIAQIDEVLAKLYLAKESVLVDGHEYFKEGSEMFQTELTDLSGTESEPPAPLTELEIYFRENYTKKDTRWHLDLAGADGIDEMLVVTAPDAEGYVYVRIYTTYDSEISMIFEEKAGTTPGERKAMYLLNDGYGNYALFYYHPQHLQNKMTSIEVFALKTYGGYIYLRQESSTKGSEVQEILNDVVWQFYQLNPYWEELFNTLIGSEAAEIQTAFDAAGVVLGESPDELTMEQEYAEDEFVMPQEYAEDEFAMPQEYAEDEFAMPQEYTEDVYEDTSSNLGYQMPEDIFWSISDPFNSYQLRFRNESDGYYMDLTDGDGYVYSTPCTIDMGGGTEFYIDDQGLLQQYVISFSPDFTGGGYSISFHAETYQIYVVTMNGEWIELYFFDN